MLDPKDYEYDLPNKLFVIQNEVDTYTHVGSAKAHDICGTAVSKQHCVGVYKLVAIQVMEYRSSSRTIGTIWKDGKEVKK